VAFLRVLKLVVARRLKTGPGRSHQQRCRHEDHYPIILANDFQLSPMTTTIEGRRIA